MNVSSIIYVSFPTEENIHRTNHHVYIVLVLSRTEFQKYCKGIGSFEKREVMLLLYGTGYSSYFIQINPTWNELGRITVFIIDEIMLQIGSDYEWWLWVAIEPAHKQVLGVCISRHKKYASCWVIPQFIDQGQW